MIAVGDKVQLVKSIYDDGADHHPPGWIAYLDEIVIVKQVKENGYLSVAHEGNKGSFIIFPDEYEILRGE